MKLSRLFATGALALGMITLGQAGAAGVPDVLYQRALSASQAAGTPSFRVGQANYQVVPGATVVRGGNSAAPHARSSGAAAVAQVGPYAITLTNDAASPSARVASPGATGYAAVVNLRTAQPGLLAPRLKLYTDGQGRGEALAGALGGNLVLDGKASGIVILRFASPAAALEALPHAASQPGVTAAEPVVVTGFPRPR